MSRCYIYMYILLLHYTPLHSFVNAVTTAITIIIIIVVVVITTTTCTLLATRY